MSDTVALRPVAFAELDGWVEDDHAAAFRAFLKSCHLDPELPFAEAAIILGEGASREAARTFFEEFYTPHRIDGGAPGFVTGYYEAEVNGSRVRDERFCVPVYGKPNDLITRAAETERARFNDRVTGFHATPEGEVPYYTRAEIEAGALAGRGFELLYLDDWIALFYMQVQGSGLVHLDDGTSVRLTYAGKNGHPYTSIGKLLVERGEMCADDIDMDKVKAWLSADPARGRALMQENESYIFFRELSEAGGRDAPFGAEGVPLTPCRSLAIDTEFQALGSPIYVSAPQLETSDGRPFRRLMIAHDVGSAIRGPQRGDIFFGTGEEAGALAGRTRHGARFFALLPKR